MIEETEAFRRKWSTLTYRLVTPSFHVVRTVGALADPLSALRVRGEGHLTLNVHFTGVPDSIRHCEQILLESISTLMDSVISLEASLRVGSRGKYSSVLSDRRAR